MVASPIVAVDLSVRASQRSVQTGVTNPVVHGTRTVWSASLERLMRGWNKAGIVQHRNYRGRKKSPGELTGAY
jgi:hypothetical protein